MSKLTYLCINYLVSNNIYMKKMIVILVAILLTINITPSFAHENHNINISRNNLVETPYIEKFCNDIVFTKKIKRTVCKDILFTSSNSKEVNFCAKAVINKKNVRKCKKYTLTPSNFTVPEEIDNDSTIEVPQTSNSPEIIPGKDQPEGYLIDLYSNNGQPARWESCREITYSIIGKDNEKRLVKELIPYIIEIFGYNLREIDGGRYQPFNENSNDLKIADIYFYFDYDQLDVKAFIDQSSAYGLASNNYIFDYATKKWITNGSNIAVKMTSTNQYVSITDSFVKAVLLHEIGHAFGLGHTNDVNQVMYYASNRELQKYQSGDLAGIEFLKNDKSKCGNIL